jgi:hypothetical protein
MWGKSSKWRLLATLVRDLKITSCFNEPVGKQLLHHERHTQKNGNQLSYSEKPQTIVSDKGKFIRLSKQNIETGKERLIFARHVACI